MFRIVMSILWNAVTSPETLLNAYSVKTMLYKTPPLYFIVLASSLKNIGGQGYWAMSFNVFPGNSGE